ncbi:MAG: hypothetical protein Q7T11_02535 [Deltaproteobacteria bacterium]|nr:hypothetical protein [Deltaproteobacteria bacterium]
MKEKIFDQRTVRKQIEDGTTKEEDYKKFLKTLPDESANADQVPYEDEDDLKAAADDAAAAAAALLEQESS